MNNEFLKADDLIEAIVPNSSTRYNVRKNVFVICEDPFESKNPLDVLRIGYRISMDIARRTESPVLCYSSKLGMFGFNQWTIRVGPISKQHLFDIQVSQMLRCHYVAVYGSTITESMEELLSVAKVRMQRIDFRTI